MKWKLIYNNNISFVEVPGFSHLASEYYEVWLGKDIFHLQGEGGEFRLQ